MMVDKEMAKITLLAGLEAELDRLSEKEIKAGRLNVNKPYDLKNNTDRLINLWRKNIFTGKFLERFEVTDIELSQIIRRIVLSKGLTISEGTDTETEAGDSTPTT
jgi:intergrase/recombinase